MAEHGLDELAAELYVVEPARFVALRTAAVAQARNAGRHDLATAIGRLRRPTMSAWAVNLLVRAAPGQLRELLSLGEELRAAQQQLQGDQLRRLTQRRRELVGSLADRARRLAADAGHPLSAAALIEVEQTLGAALADPRSAEAVSSGQLVRPLQHVGLGPEPLVAAALRPATRTDPVSGPVPDPASGPARQPSSPQQDEIARHRRRRAERTARELARADQELTEATTRAGYAEQQVRLAEKRSADLQRRLAELKQDCDRAEQDLEQAQRRARSAARVRADAERRVQRLAGQRHEAR